MILRILTLIFLCSGLAQSLGAQIMVTGRVTGEGSPLQRATVLCGRAATLTDGDGYFALRLNPGKYHLQVTMNGYKPFHREFDADSLPVEFSIEMESLAENLSEVVVTGTSKPVHRLQSPVAVEVYTPQFFRKNPSPTLFESLQHVNGVRPQINCSVCNTGDIHINGLEGPYTMVTIDGMPVVSSLSSVYGLFGIPTQLIERVEIIKGPASGLYGPEAIGGLINIITRSPEKSPRLAATVMSTSWREHSVDAGIRYKAGKKADGLTGISYFNYQRPVDRNSDGFTDITLQHRLSLFSKYNLKRSSRRDASFAARVFYEDRWGGQMNWNSSFRGGDSIYGESIYTKRLELLGNYQLPLREKITLNSSVTFHDQNSWYGVIPYMAQQKIIFGQLKWEKQAAPAHDLLSGIAFRYQYYDDNSTATVDTFTKVNRPEVYLLPGIFLQDEWSLSPGHLLLLGLRYDYHPVHRSIFTPRMAYKWSVRHNHVFRLNAGTGFRVVNLFTEDHAALTGARAVEIGEELEPEKSYNANINYLFHGGSRAFRYSFDLSAWYTHFNNQIIPDYDTHPEKIIYSNLKGYAVSKGITLNTEFNHKQRLKMIAGITLQKIEKVEEDNGIEKLRVVPVLTESWSGTWSASYSFPLPGITIDYTGSIYGPMRLPLLSELDPRRPYSPVWSLQNIQFTKRFNAMVEIFGGVKNLLDWTPARKNPFLIARTEDPFDRHVQYLPDGTVAAVDDPSAGAAHNPYALSFDPSYIYAPNQGRRLFAGARISIQ